MRDKSFLGWWGKADPFVDVADFRDLISFLLLFFFFLKQVYNKHVWSLINFAGFFFSFASLSKCLVIAEFCFCFFCTIITLEC